jgi:hypothetical protein
MRQGLDVAGGNAHHANADESGFENEVRVERNNDSAATGPCAED